MNKQKETDLWDSELFKKRFSTLVNESGKTTRELAAEIKVSDPLISLWKTGKRTPNIGNVISIASYFNVSVDWLLGLEDEDNRSKTLDARAAAEYTGLTEEAVECLHRPIWEAATQSDKNLEYNLHDRMSILIEYGVLEDLVIKLDDFIDAVENREKTLMKWVELLSSAKQDGTLYKIVYAHYPKSIVNNGKRTYIDFDNLGEYPGELDKFKHFVDSFDTMKELADYITSDFEIKERCDLIQFQIQKILTEEIQRTEKEAITLAHEESGESNGTDNKENG